MIPDAITYPFRGGDWIMIVVGSLLSMLMQVGGLAPVIGIVALVFAGGYFAAFYFDIVGTTINGRGDCPDWPDVASFFDDIIKPFFQVVGAILIAYAPLFAVEIWMSPDHSAYEAAVQSARIFGGVYFPMALLAVVLFGHLGAALPHLVVPALIRAMPEYLVAAAIVVAMGPLFDALRELAWKIPYLGWFLVSAITLYSMMMQGRLLGLLYARKREKIGWG